MAGGSELPIEAMRRVCEAKGRPKPKRTPIWSIFNTMHTKDQDVEDPKFHIYEEIDEYGLYDNPIYTPRPITVPVRPLSWVEAERRQQHPSAIRSMPSRSVEDLFQLGPMTVPVRPLSWVEAERRQQHPPAIRSMPSQSVEDVFRLGPITAPVRPLSWVEDETRQQHPPAIRSMPSRSMEDMFRHHSEPLQPGDKEIPIYENIPLRQFPTRDVNNFRPMDLEARVPAIHPNDANKAPPAGRNDTEETPRRKSGARLDWTDPVTICNVITIAIGVAEFISLITLFIIGYFSVKEAK